jgi:outer membrane protein OmpA-like peptidoglycan-associated protein
MPVPRLPLAAGVLILLSCASGCAARVEGPSPELRLRKVVLYQNGIGYFERTGTLPEGRLRMQFREREVDDVLKSLVVVEEGLDAAREKPSTVSVRLSDRAKKADDEGSEALDLVLSRQVPRRMSIAYEVPTAVWKATYRVILPDAKTTEHAGMALVQAWALIDNASDEDWNGVQVSLATGAPLSFSTDLRTTQFVERPSVSLAPRGLATGAVVAEQTRTMDRDGDGIPDERDKCPDAPGPATGGSEDGCPRAVRVSENEIRVLQQVVFDKDSDVVPPGALPILGEIAQVLKTHPELAVEIEGHASAGEKEPWIVAARRAGAVRSALQARGVRAPLEVRSFGDTRPIADAATEEGRRKNRRVEFHIAAQNGEHEEPAQTKGGEFQHDVGNTAGAAASAQEIAGAVRYDITDPVSIAKHSSNLVTIVNRYVPGEEVLLYRPDPAVPASTTHPFRAARLDNHEGIELQAGSVAIYSGGTFVGEGLLGHLRPGDKTLVPYAVDGATEVRTSAESSQHPVRIVGIARGVLTVEDEETVATRYEADVGDQPPAKLVLRHERRAGFDAQNLPPGTETTPEAFVVPLPVRARTRSVLVVEERRTVRRTIDVADAPSATLALYAHGSGLAPDLEKRVRDLVSLRGEIERRDQEIASLREALTDAAARAGELRESLRAVERTPRAAGMQKELLQRLAEATRTIEAQSAALTEKTTAQSLAKGKLGEALREMRWADAPR